MHEGDEKLIVYLSKKICLDSGLSNKAVGVYVALKSLYRTYKNVTYINVNMLCHELTGAVAKSRAFKESIVQGIEELITDGLVEVSESAGKNEWVLDLSGLYIDVMAAGSSTREYYIAVEHSEIQKVFSIEGRSDKFGLLRYFVVLLGTLDSNITAERVCHNKAGGWTSTQVKNFLGHMGTDYLAKAAGVAKDVGIAYTKLLEAAGLVYVYRYKCLIQNENGEVTSFPNNYGRYKDADVIRKYAMGYEESRGVKQYDVCQYDTKSQRNRSLAQKYNYFVKGKKYDLKTVFEIFDYIHNKNLTLAKICAHTEDAQVLESYQNQMKDESCFAEYLDENGNFRR